MKKNSKILLPLLALLISGCTPNINGSSVPPSSSSETPLEPCYPACGGEVAGISLNKTKLTLEIGQRETLIATVDTNSELNKRVLWSSNDESIATVDDNGEIEAINEGEAEITATVASDPDKKAVAEVIVKKEVPREPAPKIKMSLASTVATDRGDVQIQTNNEQIKTILENDVNSRHSPNRAHDPSEVSYTILESSAVSFDLAISGLYDDEFDITITRRLDGVDITKDFTWVRYFGKLSPADHERGYEFYSLDYEGFDPSNPGVFKGLANFGWGHDENNKGYDYHLAEKDGFRLYRLMSTARETLDVSELEVYVHQETEIPNEDIEEFIQESRGTLKFGKQPNRSGGDGTTPVEIDGTMIVKTFDFDVEYTTLTDEVYGDYTDLNNIKFSISSDEYDVQYFVNEGDTPIAEGVLLDLDLVDEMTPFTPVSIEYKKTGEEYWTRVDNYMIVFPHIGNVNKEVLRFDPEPSENASFKLALGSDSARLNTAGLCVVYDDLDSNKGLFIYENFNWTGIHWNANNMQVNISGRSDSLKFREFDLFEENSVLYGYSPVLDNSPGTLDVFPEELFGRNGSLVIDGVTFALGVYTQGNITDRFGFDVRLHYFDGSTQTIFK